MKTIVNIKQFEKKRKGHTHVQWIISMLANTSLLTYGLQAGWVTPMFKILKSNDSPTGYPLSDYDLSFIASSMTLSAMFGVSIFSYIVDSYGRKVGVVIVAAMQAICWIIKLSSPTTLSFIIARVFCGLAAGGCYNVIPMYVREISENNIRGLLGSLFTLFQNIGILAMFAMGAYFDYYTLLWIVVWIPTASVLLFLKAPESPAFLVKKGKIDQAASTLAFLRGLDPDDKLILNEIDYMKNEELHYKSWPHISLLNIFENKAWRRSFLLGISLVGVQACSGNFAILTYASVILSAANVTFNPELQTLSFPAVMIIGSFISMSCIERFGRKVLLAVSLLITVVCMASIGIILLCHQNNMGSGIPSWLPVVIIVICLCAYGSGVSPLPYIIMSEIFNFQVRAKLMGCAVTFAWFMSTIQLGTFTPLSIHIGTHFTFFFYSGINLFGFLVTLIFLPETKGKTIEEIEDAMGKKSVAKLDK